MPVAKRPEQVLVAPTPCRGELPPTNRPATDLAKRACNHLLRLLEMSELQAAREPAAPQIFITGLPRSGTTLVSQYAVHRFGFAYFTRAAGDWPCAACTVTRWQRFWYRRYSSDFVSRLGKSQGPVAPRETGAFWGSHLGFEDYVLPAAIDSATRELVRRTVWRVQNNANDTPFMNKNAKHLLRLEVLLDIFPNAAFIIVKRDLADIALSLLDARRELGSDQTRWFSVRPPSYLELVGLAPIEQIARQVVDLHDKMEQDLERLPATRVTRLPYREFCREPEILGDIVRRYHPKITLTNPPQRNFAFRVHTPHGRDERTMVARVKELEVGQKATTRIVPGRPVDGR